MNWLVRLVSGPDGELSSKRVTMLIAAVSMAVADIILAVAALYGVNVDVAITGVSASLAGLCGYSYVNGQGYEAKP